MPALSELLPEHSKTVDAIYAVYAKRGAAEPPRTYLGCSELGGPCSRRLWYKYRNLCREEFDGRMIRLFATGNFEEPRVVADLRSIGCEVHEVDESGQQFSISALNGKLSGHLDGCVLGIPEAPKTWHVLEIKTHSEKSFQKLVKEGVEKSKPQHYCQMILYMGLSGMTRALYVAKNKNTDELYTVRIDFDQAAFDALMDRAWHVINDVEPPGRISTREDYFECSWCAAKKICWNPMILKAEEVFGAVVTGYQPEDILNRYPSGDTRLMRQMDAKYLKEEWKRLYNEDIEKIEPIAKCDGFDYQAAEFPGGRCVIVWADKKCEIREGIQ